jgi:hypothetical protein
MFNFIIAAAAIFALMAGWIAVQHAARIFAAKHPEFGPAKEESMGLGCGKSCAHYSAVRGDRELAPANRTTGELGSE